MQTGAGGGIREPAVEPRVAQNPVAGHSLRWGLNAAPPASQASAPGVAIETQLCSNDANVNRRTVAPTYST